MLNYKRSKSKGFTMMEIISVLAVIGVLAGFLVPMMSGAGSEAEARRVAASINTLEAAVNQYFAENQKYPTTLNIAGFNKFLPQNEKVTAFKPQVSYTINDNNTFCLSGMVGEKRLLRQSQLA